MADKRPAASAQTVNKVQKVPSSPEMTPAPRGTRAVGSTRAPDALSCDGVNAGHQMRSNLADC